MHVAQFLDAFGFGPNVEVIESLLPDMLWGAVEEGGLGRIRCRQNLFYTWRVRPD